MNSHAVFLSLVLLALAMLAVSRLQTVPVELHVEAVDQGLLDARQRRFFAAADDSLQGMDFRPDITVRVVNCPAYGICRIYSNSRDSARIMVWQAQRGGGGVRWRAEIVTRYKDGTALYTENTPRGIMFGPAPRTVRQSFPGVWSMAELKQCHDRKAAELAAHGALWTEGRDPSGDIKEDHRRFFEYQFSKKLLRLDPDAAHYRAAYLASARSFMDLINPFADNFTLPRFLCAVGLGTALPLAVLAIPRSGYGWAGTLLRLKPLGVHFVAIAAAFSLSGLVAGRIFRSRSFVWAFLLSLLPAYLLGLGAAAPLWSLEAGLGAVLAARMKRRMLGA